VLRCPGRERVPHAEVLADAEGHPSGVGVEGGGDQEADEVDEAQHIDGADKGGCGLVWGEVVKW
jgi:hypothetical protein